MPLTPNILNSYNKNICYKAIHHQQTDNISNNIFIIDCAMTEKTGLTDGLTFETDFLALLFDVRQNKSYFWNTEISWTRLVCHEMKILTIEIVLQ